MRQAGYMDRISRELGFEYRWKQAWRKVCIAGLRLRGMIKANVKVDVG